jgi:gliding motility associated protien GldN
MNRNIVVSILLLVALGINFDASAQKPKKKTGTGTTKKGGKKPKTTAAPETTTATEPVPAEQPVVNEFPVPAEDTGVSTPDIVADEEKFDFTSIEVDTAKPTDGYYKLSNLKGAKPFPFPKGDKNSVKFYKRIWREISTIDTENNIFAIPGETLIQFLMDGIKAGKLYAYEDDGFKKKMSYSKVIGKFKDSSVQTIIDSTGEITGTKTVANEFNPDSITRFEIKEDIYFDKVRGRVVTEIISLGPIKKLKTTTGIEISDSHPFYLRFDQCRRLLAAREVVDPQRDIYNISFDDVFLQRAFKSTIIKESNPANMRIKDKYPDRARQIKESNRIEREIQRYKRNLWKFN